MNSVEVWHIQNSSEIEEQINSYCRRYALNPLSISVAENRRDGEWLVCVVAEHKED